MITEKEEIIFELDHARHDRLHCLAPGLFRSLKRGERKKSKLDISYQFGNNNLIRFVGFEPLGVDDMRLLQGLVALAGPDGIVLKSNQTAQLPKKLRLSLDTKLDSEQEKCLVVKQSISKLLSEIGLTDGGDNIKAVKASLLRMANITVLVQQNTYQASFHLLSYAFEENSGQLYVALNPQLTKAILGKNQYVYIDMTEVRKLKSDYARLMHQRLCGWIDLGKSNRITIDSLCEYVWHEKTNPVTMRKRRQMIKKGLEEIISLGWVISEYSKGKFEIKRPSRAL